MLFTLLLHLAFGVVTGSYCIDFFPLRYLLDLVLRALFIVALSAQFCGFNIELRSNTTMLVTLPTHSSLSGLLLRTEIARLRHVHRSMHYCCGRDTKTRMMKDEHNSQGDVHRSEPAESMKRKTSHISTMCRAVQSIVLVVRLRERGNGIILPDTLRLEEAAQPGHQRRQVHDDNLHLDLEV